MEMKLKIVEAIAEHDFRSKKVHRNALAQWNWMKFFGAISDLGITDSSFYRKDDLMESIYDCFKLNNDMKIPCVGFGTYKAAEGK